METSKKPTFSRVGALCFIAFGLTLASCQRDSVEPQMPTENVATASTQTDSVRVHDDDHPPKDTGGGHGN